MEENEIPTANMQEILVNNPNKPKFLIYFESFPEVLHFMDKNISEIFECVREIALDPNKIPLFACFTNISKNEGSAILIEEKLFYNFIEIYGIDDIYDYIFTCSEEDIYKLEQYIIEFDKQYNSDSE